MFGNRCNHLRSEWTWKQCQWRGTPYSPNLTACRLTIRWFNVIFRTLFGEGSYPSVEMQPVYSTAPAKWAGKCEGVATQNFIQPCQWGKGYAGCIFFRNVRLSQKKNGILGMALNCIHWWGSNSEKCGAYLHGHYFYISSDQDC